MRKAIVLAAGLAILSTSAWSQTSTRDRDDYYGGSWRERSGGWDRDSDDRRDRSEHDEERRFERGASFWLRSGDTQVRIVCDGRESMRACVDATLTLFDRVQSQARSPSPSAPVAPPSSQP